MPRKQRLKDEDGEDDELPSGLPPSKRIARKPRKQRLKDEDEEEDDELPSGLLPSSRIAHTARKQQLKDEEDGEDAVELPQRRGKLLVDDEPENEPVEPPTRRACGSSLARATALCAGAVMRAATGWWRG